MALMSKILVLSTMRFEARAGTHASFSDPTSLSLLSTPNPSNDHLLTTSCVAGKMPACAGSSPLLQGCRVEGVDFPNVAKLYQGSYQLLMSVVGAGRKYW